MTTAITRARPEDVMRAAALLGATADELGTAEGACRRSADVHWVGRAQESYQSRLGGLARDLVGVRSAFDAACDALLAYARALSYAVSLGEEADRLALLGDESLLVRVDALRWEATQTEIGAAARLINVLHELADRAPHSDGWTTAQHDAANFAVGVKDWVVGWGSLASSLVGSLPGVGSSGSRSSSRHELGSAAADLAQPWKQVEDLVDAIRNGAGFRAGGSLAMAAVFKYPGARESKSVKLFGTQDYLSLALLKVMRRGYTGSQTLTIWAAARIQNQLVADFKRLERVPLPSLDELLSDGVNLTLQEAHKGHTMWKHVGRDEDFLRHRQRVEPGRGGGPKPIASFDTLDQAEAMVDQTLRANIPEIRAFIADTDGRELIITSSLVEPVGLVLSRRGQMVPATGIRVVLKKDGRALYVATAHPI